MSDVLEVKQGETAYVDVVFTDRVNAAQDPTISRQIRITDPVGALQVTDATMGDLTGVDGGWTYANAVSVTAREGLWKVEVIGKDGGTPDAIMGQGSFVVVRRIGAYWRDLQNVVAWRLGPWDDVWDLDSGGTVATATANRLIQDSIGAGALGVSAGGTYPDWLNPIIAATGYKTISNITFNSVFDPPAPADAYDTWKTAMELNISAWLPDIFYVDQEGNGVDARMPADIRAALDAAGLTDTPDYYYKGDEAFGLGTGSAPAPAYYYQLRDNETVFVNDSSLWKQADPVAAMQTRLADSLNGVDGGYPWITPYLQANNTAEGLMTSDSDMTAVCQELKDNGALGIHWWDGTKGLTGSTYDGAVRLQRVAAEVFA